MRFGWRKEVGAGDTAAFRAGPVTGTRHRLKIVDDCTKEAVDIVVDRSITGEHVVRVLEQAAWFRGLPAAIRTDQGPEFTSRALDQWAYRNGVELNSGSVALRR